LDVSHERIGWLKFKQFMKAVAIVFTCVVTILLNGIGFPFGSVKLEWVGNLAYSEMDEP